MEKEFRKISFSWEQLKFQSKILIGLGVIWITASFIKWFLRDAEGIGISMMSIGVGLIILGILYTWYRCINERTDFLHERIDNQDLLTRRQEISIIKEDIDKLKEKYLNDKPL